MRHGGDRGAATTILVMGMALVLVAMTLLLNRIAHANDLRTRAQIAADAAALAAAGEIADNGAGLIVQRLLPHGILFEDDSREAARRYAAANDARVDEVRPSGFFGYTVKVRVHTNQCQTRPIEQKPLSRIACRTEEEHREGWRGTATAIARVNFPLCEIRSLEPENPLGPGDGPPRVGIFCNNRLIHDFATARRLFTVRLVDEEDPTPFNPAFFSSIGIPPGGVANQANRELGRRLAAELGWTGEQWNCLDQLWQRESGWNHLAHNESSGAHGIPQSLPASKMATYGADYMTNPRTQIRWGLDYIAGRYGSPCAAWAWWQRTDPRPHPGHWY